IISRMVCIPTIGIGAGSGFDGQILVTDDLLGKYTDFKPRFVRQYANLSEICTNAITEYAEDVRSMKFPNDTESFAFTEEEEEKLRELMDENAVTATEISC